jgi:hypothetical protein
LCCLEASDDAKSTNRKIPEYIDVLFSTLKAHSISFEALFIQRTSIREIVFNTSFGRFNGGTTGSVINSKLLPPRDFVLSFIATKTS